MADSKQRMAEAAVSPQSSLQKQCFLGWLRRRRTLTSLVNLSSKNLCYDLLTEPENSTVRRLMIAVVAV